MAGCLLGAVLVMILCAGPVLAGTSDQTPIGSAPVPEPAGLATTTQVGPGPTDPQTQLGPGPSELPGPIDTVVEVDPDQTTMGANAGPVPGDRPTGLAPQAPRPKTTRRTAPIPLSTTPVAEPTDTGDPSTGTVASEIPVTVLDVDHSNPSSASGQPALVAMLGVVLLAGGVVVWLRNRRNRRD